MEPKEAIKSAINSLRMNTLRSLLTMLGIIIGITSVIIISSVGESTVAYISNELTSFGTNYFQVNAGNDLLSAMRGGGKPLTTRDVQAIKDANIANIETISGFSVTSRDVSTKDESTTVTIYGFTPEIADMLKPNMIYGNFLTTDDANSRVAVLGSDVSDKLFGKNTDPVGESVKIGDLKFSVIGVSKSGSGLFGTFFNTAVNIPLETLQTQITGEDNIREIDVAVYNTDSIDETMDEVKMVLRDFRHLAEGEDDDFMTIGFTASLDVFNRITNLLTLFITGISAISLLVGGVGVMNIMLVSVTERTKEIGLLKAIGAKRKDILAQFLIESSVMTTIGGFIGIIFGILITYLISLAANIPFVISLPWILIATVISTSVGIVFGLYPARKASFLHPIDALRFE